MIERLNDKIEKELEKVINREDFNMDDLKTLIEIKNSIEMHKILKETIDDKNLFQPVDIEKGE